MGKRSFNLYRLKNQGCDCNAQILTLKNKIMSREEKQFRNDAKNFCVFIGMIALSAFIVVNFILVK
jgi:hypothetical protein